jgi:acetyl esterase/lipase
VPRFKNVFTSDNDMLTRWATWIATVSALLSSWLTYRPNLRGLSANLIAYGLKIIGGALSPLLALAGLTGALLAHRSRKASPVILGGLGAMVATHYIRRVTALPDRLAVVFGDAEPVPWRDRVLPRRWRIGQVVQRPRPRFVKDVIFAAVPGTDRDLRCDLWLPAPGVPRSRVGIIYLHGGGWQSFDKDVATRPFFRHLAAQGHVVMDVAYRMARETDMQGMLDDVKRALAWLKAHAAELGVDADRVVLAGGSAGGHLALLAAYTADLETFAPEDVRAADTTVCGVVAYYPVADLRTLTDHWSQQSMHPLATVAGQALGYFPPEGFLTWSKLTPRLFGGPPAEVNDALLTYSPVAHVGAHCPPTLILQGTYDHVIPVEDVYRLHAALEAAGCQAMLVKLPQVEHAFDLFALQISPPAQAALYDVDRFLAWLAQ